VQLVICSASQQVSGEISDMTEARSATDLGRWVEDLVCPVCLGALRFAESTVACGACGRSYPVVDGIPVLIADRATQKKP